MTGMAAGSWRDPFLRRKGRSETIKVNLHAILSLGAALRLAISLHSAFGLTTSFRLASATSSVTIDGKGLRVAEHMFFDAIFDKSFRRNAYVIYLLAKPGKRIHMLYRTRRSIKGP